MVRRVPCSSLETKTHWVRRRLSHPASLLRLNNKTDAVKISRRATISGRAGAQRVYDPPIGGSRGRP